MLSLLPAAEHYGELFCIYVWPATSETWSKKNKKLLHVGVTSDRERLHIVQPSLAA